MGKENEIWDDSALVNAFDQAMAKYKAMHLPGNLSKDRKTRFVNERDEAGEGNEFLSTEPDAVNSSVSNTINEPCEPAAAENPLVLEDHEGAGPDLRDIGINIAGVPAQENLVDSNSKTLEHTQLLKQYYELEQQRQNILMLLQQANSGYYYTNPEDSASCSPWVQSSTSQGNGVLTHDPYHVGYVQSYNSNSCPCLGASSFVPPCVLGGSCVEADSAKIVSPADDNIAKVAMAASEKAFSSIRMKASTSSASCKGKQGSLAVEPEGEILENSTSSTGLAEVLNAWYSAGFYTGKYLVEQSIAKGKS